MYDFSTFIALSCPVRHYAWGERRHGGAVPLIAELTGEATDDTTPWAELWLGAHPSASALAKTPVGDIPLHDLASAFPNEVLGAGRQSTELPLLLKILCCEKSLSLQSHPDRSHATRLHATDPERYPDPNPKPEIIIALSEFHAMVGFRPPLAAIGDIRRRTALAPWCDQWQTSPSLRQLCETMLAIPAPAIPALLDNLAAEIKTDPAPTPADILCADLMRQHPHDRGALFAYLLHQLLLQPGEALYIPPNTPHAYLHGQGIECMANSDNVIRAGLTPKLIDHDALLETLDFNAHNPLSIPPSGDPPGYRCYQPPTPEFQIEIMTDTTLGLATQPPGPSLFLILNGVAALAAPDRPEQRAPRGSAWLAPAALKTGRIRPLTPNTTVVLARQRQAVPSSPAT